ncbi:hypothetical protein NECAME_12782 [Necator americanus]|uniref:Uncharacterized protein n=1 Tax=Necator americanus TaxID=51031 RepID=W2SY70_NECAM|nr:hypothetical protein NECAME_12782 [Necator americanus]ETN74714.1 hypothetical protein NECAME_12782 [Necator americanus]
MERLGVTLSEKYSTFVVRGCMEYILRHSLKKENIHKEGCYLVRSLPARFPNNFTMEYVLCVCNGDYCNGEQPPDFVPGPHSFAGEMVLPLNQKEEWMVAPGKRIKLEISSSALSFMLSSWLCSLRFMAMVNL